ncbi:MAG: hypothetical protein AAGK97_15960, partial [Bacteroidota bacterium]
KLIGYNVPFDPINFIVDHFKSNTEINRIKRYIVSIHFNSVAFEMIDNDMEITFPFEGESLLNGENYYIVWDDFIGESNTYNLEYSINGGSSWTSIISNLQIEANKSRTYNWNLPTIASDRVQIKITSGSRTYITGNFTVSDRPSINEPLLFNTQNELAMSWTNVQGASSYNIYKYASGDVNPVLLTNTTSTSANITGLDAYDKNFMIVEPVFSNGAGVKSTAVKALAQILYVDENANGTGDGKSWASAFTSLSDAVFQGAGEIWVAEGTYNSYAPYRSLASTFKLKKAIKLYGGFPNPSSHPGGNPNMNDRNWEMNPTIIDGSLSTSNVFTMEDATSIDGFIIRDQSTTGNGGIINIEAIGVTDTRNIEIRR